MAYNTINDVAPKDAGTKEERLLLGYLDKKARAVGFGKIQMVFTVRNGRIETIHSQQIDDSFNIGDRQA